jgi:hypothetical protein
VIPEWHQVSDTLERVDPAAVERTETFVLELLRRLDATAASSPLARTPAEAQLRS